ncbi:hypothetical protein MBLNU230_g4931t1 [Neophaeotheca triangularis]
MDLEVAHQASSDPSSVKKRAACDECRTKKLKCTGEQPACARCVREELPCVYSVQKRMGRPKKRARSEEEGSEGGQRRVSAGGGREGALSAHQDGVEEVGSSAGPHHHLDSDTFDGAFAADGGLQPWLHEQQNWNFDAVLDDFQAPSHDRLLSVPELTPDSSSGRSPPTVNLLPELQSGGQHAHGNTHDLNAQPFLDPLLSSYTQNPTQAAAETNNSTTNLPNQSGCACLSTMYLTLSDLQNMDSTFPFPFAFRPLRSAMQTASEVVTCQQCPKSFITAIQNTQLLGTLLVTIAERFGKILDSITAEAARAESEGVSKKFRLAELSQHNSHLHTGGWECAAGFNIDLSAGEWMVMAKKVVKAEVYGPSDGNDCCVSFVALIEQMQARQERWHSLLMPADSPKDRQGVPIGGKHLAKEDHICLKLARYARRIVDGHDWS